MHIVQENLDVLKVETARRQTALALIAKKLKQINRRKRDQRRTLSNNF